MSLCGTLQDLPIPDLLQMIAANRKTGRLVLTRRDGHGVIAFRNGQTQRRAPWVSGPADGEPIAPEPPPDPEPPSFASLKSIMSEIRSPAFTGEVSLGILRYAARSFTRGVLFARGYDGFQGMGQFGLGSKVRSRWAWVSFRAPGHPSDGKTSGPFGKPCSANIMFPGLTVCGKGASGG